MGEISVTKAMVLMQAWFSIALASTFPRTIADLSNTKRASIVEGLEAEELKASVICHLGLSWLGYCL